MALTQAQYDAYEQQAIEAYAARKGADSITFENQSTHFESWDSIWKWLAWLKGQIPVSESGSKTRYVATSKGV